MVNVIYDYFVAQLNSGGNNYRGNFLFQMHDETFTAYELVTGKLVKEAIDYLPVSLQVAEAIPFVEQNRRNDWLVSFGVLVRVAGLIYDSTVDTGYDEILDVTYSMQGLTATMSDGNKYSFKTSPPKMNGMVQLGGSKYLLVTVTMNVTEIEQGNFGQDSAWTVGSYTPDVISVSKTSTRRYYTADVKSAETNDYNKPIGRAVVVTMTFNYNGETDLLDEVDGKSALTKTYTVTDTFSGVTPARVKSWTMTCQQATETQTINGVKRLTCVFVEV